MTVVPAIAHLAEDGREHLLEDHLRRVGQLASEFASPWGATDHARVAGELHDLGKYAADFQAYIRNAQRSDVDRRAAHIEIEPDESNPHRRVDHSTAGAIHARAEMGAAGSLIAFVIAGHHCGLSNRTDLTTRLDKPEKEERLAEALKAGPPVGLLSPTDLPAPFSTKPTGSADRERIFRRLELWTRMLFSALCDADFLDTEEFFDRTRVTRRELARASSLDDLLARLTRYVDTKERGASATAVNLVRREIRAASIAASVRPPGVFTLTVPTGGGKTLAGMEFALHHAKAHGLRRVIVAIPYTSILEQNADVYREAFGDDDVVLEHHSNFDPQRETPRSRLAAQNWDVPVVVTTNVQLFESLFARRTSRCRKLHNLAKSVIVLDEAQTMPVNLLAATLEVLGDLVRDYGVSVVISTGTQPALGRESLPYGLEHAVEIVPADVRAFERLRRVKVRWPESRTATPYGVLAREVVQERDVLAITHKRNDARELTELLDAALGDTSTIHLSALMCAEHRSVILADVKRRKKNGEAVRVVSTQLVEAGVDLDFPVVYRALAGLDSMAQAAGRCNREGLLSSGELRIFIPESSPPPGVLRAGLAITEGMLRSEPALPFLEGGHYRSYFERLYSTADTDKKAVQAARASLRFEDVANLYKMIEDDWSAPIVVRYGRSSKLLDELTRQGSTRSTLRALGRFSVNAPKRHVLDWIATGHALQDEESGVVSFAPHVDAYDARFGLVPDRVSTAASASSLIVDG
jgi:CRISPR-associated endonuclease/helicase Cas3